MRVRLCLQPQGESLKLVSIQEAAIGDLALELNKTPAYSYLEHLTDALTGNSLMLAAATAG